MSHLEDQAITGKSDSKTGDSPLTMMENRLNEEISRRENAENDAAVLREKVNELSIKLAAFSSSQEKEEVATAKADGAVLATWNSQGSSQVAILQAENQKLRHYVRRQNALIDVLSRQKVLLEASTALTISSKDFVKDLELEKV
ncbi:hypothetical protein ABB37_06819 [Leptomonas pyrrhocoris]|uniref:Uncharacterized protein n=1 Tax=Leptomonas pyrrhocoris TaxID=157538 RepID=A0A0M9FWB5_LEPPY|nr:hypothetical protein ABB37_06819 [Leptomonas pyrrhocoris]KPA77410.1 hypothetical protein ABB37_06819 [Leptomonas pyrrhocoris]|eukprot:XP_015655849.1 hypothetical protein ABB37_06819 [Leptomonas pyrrhocoris]